MKLIEMCELFNITDINKEDSKSLRRKYKKLMKIYHPDNIGSNKNSNITAVDINEAFNELLVIIKDIEILKRLEKAASLNTVLIDLNTLIDVLEGKEVDLINGDICTYSYINRNNTYIRVEISIEINGLSTSFYSIQPYNKMNEYSVDVEIPISDYKDTVNVRASKYNKNIDININNSSIYRLIVKPHKDIKVALNIKKVLIKKKENTVI